MPLKFKSSHKRRRLFSFRRDERGATAVEFALLALPFFLLIFNTLETAYSFAGRQMMANAADDISRKFRTGQITSIDQPTLHTMVCDNIKVMVADCNDLIVDMRTAQSFADLTKVTIDPNGGITGGNKYEIGGPMSKNMLHVMYKWPIFTDLVGRFAHQMPNERGKMLITAVAIWQNEPF